MRGGSPALLLLPWALSAQVFNYEPYDDSDLLGPIRTSEKASFRDEHQRREGGWGLQRLLQRHGLWGPGRRLSRANQHSGTARLEQRRRGNGNTVRNRIAQDLGLPDAGAMSVASYPIDQRYDISFGFGLRVMQRFNLENAIVLDMDIWQLEEPGRMAIEHRHAARPGAGVDRPAGLRHFCL